MNIKILFLLLLFALQCQHADAQDKKSEFRIIGYFKGDLETEAIKIDYSKITHLNVAFINPDSNGNFLEVKGLNRIVETAHAHQVKVLASIAGGRAPKYYRSLMSPSLRNRFISNILKLMIEYKLDGIDVDIEAALITPDYNTFIVELAKSIKPKGLLTAAVATEYGPLYADSSLSKFDVINIMSYDRTGPWRPQLAGQHAPFSMAVSDLLYWQKDKGVAKEKLSLGMPFYGYGFSTLGATSMSYKKIITSYAGAEERDEVMVENGGTMYYNGITTIRKKAKLALEEAGGIMVWQLLQDASGSNSLLEAINEEVLSAKK